MSETPDLTNATQRLIEVAGYLTDDQLDDPTPCAGRTVRQLLGHVVGLTAAFRAAADKELGPWTDTSPDADGWPDAEADWRDPFAARAHALAEAWQRPEAWDGTTRAGGVDLPGEVAGLVALDEVVLHGWDLARATGQPYEVGEETATLLLDFVSGFDLSGTPGLFGPAVDVGSDASTFDRVLARSGRDPQWSPR